MSLKKMFASAAMALVCGLVQSGFAAVAQIDASHIIDQATAESILGEPVKPATRSSLSVDRFTIGHQRANGNTRASGDEPIDEAFNGTLCCSPSLFADRPLSRAQTTLTRNQSIGRPPRWKRFRTRSSSSSPEK